MQPKPLKHCGLLPAMPRVFCSPQGLSRLASWQSP